MPVYNGIKFINGSVNSIKNQTYSKWELIIGINGHQKNSPVYQIAKKFESDKIKVYDLHTIKGKSKALNEILKYAKYNWIALLDVDDLWLPNKLLKQIPYINKYDIIGTNCKYFGNRHGNPAIPLGDITTFNFLQINPIINSSCLVRKELCYWEPNNILEDYDIWLRLWKQNKKFYNVSTVLVLHRIHNESAFNAQGNHLKVHQLRQKYSN